MSKIFSITLITFSLFYQGCKMNQTAKKPASGKIPVILDTDANNEIDDQHAIAYLLCGGNTFQVEGITVNATKNGGDIEHQFEEADRVVKLCSLDSIIPVIKGANGSFEEVSPKMSYWDFDGYQAVNFIIRQAKKQKKKKLVVIAIGKLTNIALALKKAPSIANKIRLVWLGSNYPEPGEYNLENDIPAMNYLLRSTIRFEMVVVRYGKPSGTDAVRITKEDALQKMPGLGPHISQPVPGRHGGTFNNFGDYSANLFEHIDYYGDPPSRALFDVCALAIVKNSEWADSISIHRPVMMNDKWIDQPDNPGEIILWENFNKDEILSDLFSTLQNYVLVH